MDMKKCAGLALTYVMVVSAFLGASCLANQAVSVIAQTAPVEGRYTVVIDAGHGGEDGGAVSCTGVKESTINLEIALKLNDLCHLLGCRTRMIRTTDTAIYTAGETLAQKKVSDLRQRVKIVNETEKAVLVSIHQNTFSEPRYSGAQVFYGPAGDSRILAEALQSCFAAVLNPGSTRKAKKAEGVYLMEHIGCTGVLAECGFLSNAAEEARLRSGGYQLRIAAATACTVCNFLDGQTND